MSPRGATLPGRAVPLIRYRYIEGIGNNVLLEFVDHTGTGEYRLTFDPREEDAILEQQSLNFSRPAYSLVKRAAEHCSRWPSAVSFLLNVSCPPAAVRVE
jgi:hypothetical protein